MLSALLGDGVLIVSSCMYDRIKFCANLYISGPKKTVAFIIRHSLIFWAHRRAASRVYGERLGQKGWSVYWLGIKGLCWYHLDSE